MELLEMAELRDQRRSRKAEESRMGLMARTAKWKEALVGNFRIPDIGSGGPLELSPHQNQQ